MVIKSKLIFGNVDLLGAIEGVYALAIAAGFSETFVPNILRKVSDFDEKANSNGK